MEAHVTRFLEKATVAQLKEKLEALGQATGGQKASLQLRLTEAVKNMPKTDLDKHFPRNVYDDLSLVDNEHLQFEQDETPTINSEAYDDEDEQLNIELEALRKRLQKKKEIQDLKRKLSELADEDDTVGSKSCYNFRDVEESLPRFSGEDNYCIQKWLQNFEESAEIFGWDSHMRFIYAKRLMIGTAKLFLRTVSLVSWQQLKKALIEEFSMKVTNADIHNQLRNRKKKRDESLQTYVLSMQEMASLASIEESDVIHYIINGITDSSVNKMLLYNANTLQELKLALKKFEKIKCNQPALEKFKPGQKDSKRQRS